MALNKHELELERQKINAEKWGMFYGYLKTLTNGIVFVICVKFFSDMLMSLASANTDTVTALAQLVEKFNLGTVSGYVLCGVASVGWARERAGKKRVLKKLDEQRKSNEAHDAYHAGSGLTPTGDTPK